MAKTWSQCCPWWCFNRKCRAMDDSIFLAMVLFMQRLPHQLLILQLSSPMLASKRWALQALPAQRETRLQWGVIIKKYITSRDVALTLTCIWRWQLLSWMHLCIVHKCMYTYMNICENSMCSASPALWPRRSVSQLQLMARTLHQRRRPDNDTGIVMHSDEAANMGNEQGEQPTGWQWTMTTHSKAHNATQTRRVNILSVDDRCFMFLLLYLEGRIYGNKLSGWESFLR